MACWRQQKMGNTASSCSKDHFLKILPWININSGTVVSLLRGSRGRVKMSASPFLLTSPSFDICWYFYMMPFFFFLQWGCCILETNTSQMSPQMEALSAQATEAPEVSRNPQGANIHWDLAGLDQVFYFIGRLLGCGIIRKRGGKEESYFGWNDHIFTLLV